MHVDRGNAILAWKYIYMCVYFPQLFFNLFIYRFYPFLFPSFIPSAIYYFDLKFMLNEIYNPLLPPRFLR